VYKTLNLIKEQKMPILNKEKGIALYAALVAFGTYVFVFGFRKSFTVCTFDGMMFGPIAYKTALVISQMLGYLLAKIYFRAREKTTL